MAKNQLLLQGIDPDRVVFLQQYSSISQTKFLAKVTKDIHVLDQIWEIKEFLLQKGYRAYFGSGQHKKKSSNFKAISVAVGQVSYTKVESLQKSKFGPNRTLQLQRNDKFVIIKPELNKIKHLQCKKTYFGEIYL